MSLFDVVTAKLAEPTTSALIMQGELEPVVGPGSAVCPPTYAHQSGNKKLFSFAFTEDTLVPKQTEGGWFHGWAELEDGPRRAPRVSLNNVAACAGHNETSTWFAQDRLGVALPAFIVDGSKTTAEVRERALKSVAKKAALSDPAQVAQLESALGVRTNTWLLPHRSADAGLKFADDGTGEQVWAGNGGVKQILLNAGHAHGDLVYAHLPNIAIYGSWLSSGTSQRHAIPRAYSCEITGYGATKLDRAATKLDEMGGANSSSPIDIGKDGNLVWGGKKKPSDFGFGQVPNHPEGRAVSCELILRQASLSLKALDRFAYADDPDGRKAFAAKRVHCLLAMAGHLLAAEDTFLRSGCDLVTVAEQWGWRSHGARLPKPLEVPTVEEVAVALRQAIDEAAELGLQFAEPVTLALSQIQVELIADRVLKASTAEALVEQ